MKTMSATHAAKGFSEMLDAVEQGESYTITRRGRVIARVVPESGSTWADVMGDLEGTGIDPEWANAVEKAHVDMNTEAVSAWDAD